MMRWNNIIVGFLACFLALPAFSKMRDPTQPPGMEYAMKAEQHTIDLQGIYYRNGHSNALIDGVYKSVGDRIGDATITAIHTDKVVLTGDDGPVVLDMSYPVIRQPIEDKGKNGAH